MKVGNRTGRFMTAKNLMSVIANAAEKLMVSYKEVSIISNFNCFIILHFFSSFAKEYKILW